MESTVSRTQTHPRVLDTVARVLLEAYSRSHASFVSSRVLDAIAMSMATKDGRKGGCLGGRGERRDVC